MRCWMISVVSLLGVWLNIERSVTNATWAYVDLKHEIYPQAALQSVYFMLAIYGICQWSKGFFHNRKDKRHES